MPITSQELDVIRANIRKANLLYQQTLAQRGYFIKLVDYNEEQRAKIGSVLEKYTQFVVHKNLSLDSEKKSGDPFVIVKFPKEDATEDQIAEFKAFVTDLNTELEKNAKGYYHRSGAEKSTEHPVATLLQVIDQAAYASLMQEHAASQNLLGANSFLKYGLSILGYNGPNFAIDGVSMIFDSKYGIVLKVGERGESGRYAFFGGMIEEPIINAVVDKYATDEEKKRIDAAVAKYATKKEREQAKKQEFKQAFKAVCERAKEDPELRDKLSYALQDTIFNHTVTEYLEEVNSIELFSNGSVGLKRLQDKLDKLTDEQQQEIANLLTEVGISKSVDKVQKEITANGIDDLVNQINGNVNKAKFKADLAIILFEKELHAIRDKINFDAITQPLFMTDTRNFGGAFMATFPNVTSTLQIELRTIFGVNELGGYDKSDNKDYQKVNLARMLNGFAGHAEIALHVAANSPKTGKDQKLVENNIRLLGERAKRVAEYTPAEYEKIFNAIENTLNVAEIKEEAKQLRKLLGMGVIEQSQFNNILGWIKNKEWAKLKTYIEILEKRTAAEDANQTEEARKYAQLLAANSPKTGKDLELVKDNIRLLDEREKRIADYRPEEYQKISNVIRYIANVPGIETVAEQLLQLLVKGVIEQSQFNNILDWIDRKEWTKLKTYIEILEKRTAAEDANQPEQARDYEQLLALCCDVKSSFTQKKLFFTQTNPFDKFLNLETAHDFACMAFYERITSDNKLFQAMNEQIGTNVQLMKPFAEILKGYLQGKKEDFGSKMKEIYAEHAARMEAGAGAANNVLDLLGKQEMLSAADKKAVRESVTLSVDTCKCFCAGGQTLSCACAKNEDFYANQQKSLVDTLALVDKTGEVPEYPVFLQSTEIHQNISYVTSAEDFRLIMGAMDAVGLPAKDKWTREELLAALKGPVKYTLPGTTTEITLTIEDMLLYLNNKQELESFYFGDGIKYFEKVKVSATTGKIIDKEIPEVFKKQGVTFANSGGITWGNHCVGTETDCGTYITRTVNNKFEDVLKIDLTQLKKGFDLLPEDEKKKYIANFCASFGLVLKGGLGPHPYSMVAEGDDYHPVLKLDPKSFVDGKLEISLSEVRKLQQEFIAQQKATVSKQGVRRPSMFASSKPTTKYPSVKSADGSFSLESMRAILDNKNTVIVQGAATGGFCVSTSDAQLLAYSKPKGVQLNVALDVPKTTGVFAARPPSDLAIVGAVGVSSEPKNDNRMELPSKQ